MNDKKYGPGKGSADRQTRQEPEAASRGAADSGEPGGSGEQPHESGPGGPDTATGSTGPDDGLTGATGADGSLTGATGPDSLTGPKDPGGVSGAGDSSGRDASTGPGDPDTLGVPDVSGVLGFPGSLGGGKPAGQEPDALDEEALRSLLHVAVDDLEPSANSLEHLRCAVSARRTHRRQALVGVAAAVVLGGAALPALVHVATTGGGADDRPANAASGERAQGGKEDGQHDGSGDQKGSDKASESGGKESGDKKGGEKTDNASKDPERGSDGTEPGPSSTLEAASSVCGAAQLGSATGSAGSADAEGRVYGSFRVVNVSSDACTVEGRGAVGTTPQGAADGTRVTVADHTAGDPAAGLPDPSTEPGRVILKPGQAFEVRFAWVPAAGGGTTGCASTSTPSPDPTDGNPGAADEPSTGPGEGDNETPPASVVVSYTPAAGGPSVARTLTEACAGTVYSTGVLAAS